MTAKSDVLVIGGGVAGVCAAHFLEESGARVTLLEAREICTGASYGNAGWIFPSHSSPLPAPGAAWNALKWLFDPESPFYIKPRFDVELFRWLWGFWMASTAEKAAETFRINRELSLRSRALYEKLAARPGLDFGFSTEGLLLVFRTQEALDEEEHEIQLLEKLGGEAHRVSPEELRERVPLMRPGLAGGVDLPLDAHVQPYRFVQGLAEDLRRRGVRFETGCEVMDFDASDRRIRRILATKGDFECDNVVLAAGAWSPRLAERLRLRLPVQSAKGYSVTCGLPEGVGRSPMMLAEAKVGISPMGNTLRIAGTLELAGLDLSINLRRVRAIERAAREYMPDLPLERIETWRGLRPCTPDDLPIIGPTRDLHNLYIATGHGMSGISQGPITGQLISQLIAGQAPDIDPEPLSPSRF